MKFYCLSTSAILLGVEINFVLCFLNTKYDFLFEGKQGKSNFMVKFCFTKYI